MTELEKIIKKQEFDKKINKLVEEKVREELDKLSPLKDLSRIISQTKGEKGDKPSEQELIEIIKTLIPNVENGKDGRTPMFVSKHPPKNPQKGDLWYQD